MGIFGCKLSYYCIYYVFCFSIIHQLQNRRLIPAIYDSTILLFLFDIFRTLIPTPELIQKIPTPSHDPAARFESRQKLFSPINV